MEDSSDARVVVAIDFGTTFSGFAYAHKSEPERVFSCYEWPDQGRAHARPYCKTQTSLFYSPDAAGKLQLRDWGWSALLGFQEKMTSMKMAGNKAAENLARKMSAVTMGVAHPTQEGNMLVGSSHPVPQIVNYVVNMHPPAKNPGSKVLYFASNFKLYLASNSSTQNVANCKLPGDLTVERLVVDYLGCLSKFIMEQLKTKYGRQFSKQRVQWCVTVPAIWDDRAKQFMKMCAQKAGLLKGPHCSVDDASPHSLVTVLEPEAASMYCQPKLKEVQLRKGDRILIADVGGGTIDLVVHSKASDEPGSVQVNEEVQSYGSLGGGTYVDQNFVEFVSQKIGSFKDLCSDNPSTALDMFSWWEGVKTGFDGSGFSAVKELSRKLSDAWETYDRQLGKPLLDDYSELRLHGSDIKAIFDPEVTKVLNLIEEQIAGCKVLVVVGGFAASPYLQKAIRERFKQRVNEILIPPDPGSAVCQGAVKLGQDVKGAIISRIARKTYGLSVCEESKPGDPAEDVFLNDDGRMMCDNVFHCFVSKGQKVMVNDCVTKNYRPTRSGQRYMSIELYSSTEKNPRSTAGGHATLEGKFEIDMREGIELDRGRSVEVRMHFGRSIIEVTAVRKNFGSSNVEKMLPVTFDC